MNGEEDAPVFKHRLCRLGSSECRIPSASAMSASFAIMTKRDHDGTVLHSAWPGLYAPTVAVLR